ncbi:MAG: electron transfer flavoprotein subunit beta/FixA family protein [Mycoplasmatales bacterium]
MKIVCLVKFVPDTTKMEYDEKTGAFNREKVTTIINPDDAACVELALRIKDKNIGVLIEIVTMGPLRIKKYLEDYIRRGVDKVTLLSDRVFAGSDSLATSKIIFTYLKTIKYDLIIAGNQTIDGDTGHVGPQVAALSNINQISNVIEMKELTNAKVEVVIENENLLATLSLKLPALISVTKKVVNRIRFTKYSELEKDVSEQITIISNEQLKVQLSEIGLKGSPTKVAKTMPVKTVKREQAVFTDVDEGVQVIYNLLKEEKVIKWRKS